ncbi:hypothetical protein ACQ86N_41620 [Puia sp. P3]|uniref:hypothetical protein n=1 Tax=Puia sp. P3 TaxID=3423952 RepID=UPI003D66E256
MKNVVAGESGNDGGPRRRRHASGTEGSGAVRYAPSTLGMIRSSGAATVIIGQGAISS